MIAERLLMMVQEGVEPSAREEIVLENLRMAEGNLVIVC